MRALAQRALKATAAGADRLRAPRPGIVVLIYHRVGAGSGLELDLPRASFAGQVAQLAGRVLTLDAALDALSTPPGAVPDPAKPNPLVVTFDDGTADFTATALGVLVAHQVPVVLYLATAFVDEGRSLPYGAPPTSWAALRDALDTGLVTIGSHTHTHALLDRVAPDVAAAELATSIRLIEDHLGVTPAHFAYPKSLPGSPSVERKVRERFRSAALAGTRPNLYGATDPYRLARTPIQAADGARFFAAKAAGGMRLEDDVRRAVNRVRHAGARS